LSHYPTISDVLKSACGERNQHLVEDKLKKRRKYRNNPCEVDGIKFDSEKEADYYRKLKILLKAGKIGFLELQVPYELNPGGTHSLKYFADFVFVDSETGEKKVVDVKGFRTAVYRKKRRLMWKVHKIKIIEV
jgi:hypothetical protein